MDRIRQGSIWALAVAFSVLASLAGIARAGELHGVRLMAAVTQTATGASPSWSWQAATTCADGTPVTPDPVKGGGCPVLKYTLYTGLQGAVKTAFGSVGPTVFTLSAPGTPPGVWCAQVTATDSAPVNPESAMSNEACITITAPQAPQVTPRAPTGLTSVVQVADTNAYKMRQAIGDYSFVVYGTVPAGTACNTAHSNDGFSVIDRSAVIMASKFDTQPLVAFAHCS